LNTSFFKKAVPKTKTAVSPPPKSLVQETRLGQTGSSVLKQPSKLPTKEGIAKEGQKLVKNGSSYFYDSSKKKYVEFNPKQYGEEIVKLWVDWFVF